MNEKKREHIDKTVEHIQGVQRFLLNVIANLRERARTHDESKLEQPELSLFSNVDLEESPHGTDAYDRNLKRLEDALEHHYANNDHHPEHHENGIQDMHLGNILEMLCDWNEATSRHPDDDIYESIETNQERFGYDDELKQILINTVDEYFNND